jgi:hypothetical protein
MNCIQSFSFTSSANDNFVAPDLLAWTAPGGMPYFQVDKNYISTFNIQGFKNVNIFGVDVIGDFQPLITTVNPAIVSDWQIRMRLNGQMPLISGNITAAPNGWSLTQGIPQSQIFTLSRFKTSFKLESPIQSVTSIQLDNLKINGIGPNSLLTVNVSWNLQFIVYYQYEGE